MKELLIVLGVLIAVFICIKLFLKIFKWAVMAAAVAAIVIYFTHQNTWQSLSDKMSSLQGKGKLSDAREVAMERLGLAGSFFNLDKGTYAKALLDVGDLYGLEGKFPEAEEYLVKAVEVYENRSDEESNKEGSAAMMKLASIYINKEEFKRAKPLLESALKRRRAVYGKDHKETMETVKSLVAVYKKTGEVSEASELSEEYKVEKQES